MLRTSNVCLHRHSSNKPVLLICFFQPKKSSEKLPHVFVWKLEFPSDTVDGSEIQREKPVEVGSLSHYLHGFWAPSKRWLALGFLNHPQFHDAGFLFSNIYHFCRKSITCQTSCKSSWTCRLSPRVFLFVWGGFPVFWRSVLKGWLRMLGGTINQMVQKGETMKGYHQPWHYVDLLRPYLYKRVTFLRAGFIILPLGIFADLKVKKMEISVESSVSVKNPCFFFSCFFAFWKWLISINP